MTNNQINMKRMFGVSLWIWGVGALVLAGAVAVLNSGSRPDNEPKREVVLTSDMRRRRIPDAQPPVPPTPEQVRAKARACFDLAQKAVAAKYRVYLSESILAGTVLPGEVSIRNSKWEDDKKALDQAKGEFDAAREALGVMESNNESCPLYSSAIFRFYLLWCAEVDDIENHYTLRDANDNIAVILGETSLEKEKRRKRDAQELEAVHESIRNACHKIRFEDLCPEP